MLKMAGQRRWGVQCTRACLPARRGRREHKRRRLFLALNKRLSIWHSDMSANHGARWTSCHSSRSSDSSGPPRQARIYAARPISSPPAGCSSSHLYMVAGACAHRRASSAPEQKMSPPYAISAGVVTPAHHSPEKGKVLCRVVVATPAHRAGPATQTTNQVGDTNSSPHAKAHLVSVSWTAVDRCWGRTSHTSAPSCCGCSSGCPHGNASSLLKWGWTEYSVRTGPLRRKEADTPRGAAVVAAGRVKAQGPRTPRPTEGLGPMLLCEDRRSSMAVDLFETQYPRFWNRT